MVLIGGIVACIEHSTDQPLMIMKMVMVVMVTATDDVRRTVVVRDLHMIRAYAVCAHVSGVNVLV